MKLPDSFNESIKKSIQKLLHEYWIVKEEDMKSYFLIREHELVLKKYFTENFRYRLIVQPDVVKLEKIPQRPKKWMGTDLRIDKYNNDYTMLMLILAFLEEKSDRQFLLKDIKEFVEYHHPNRNLKWINQEGRFNRLSLVRVINYCKKKYLLHVVDREINEFRDDENYEVLFQGTKLVRYFMRNFNFDLGSKFSFEDIQSSQNQIEDELDITLRHKLMRMLFIEPVLNEDDLTEEMKDYLKKYGHIIDHHLEKYSDYRLERYKGTSFLTKSETTSEKVFPENIQSNDTILTIQIGTLLRDGIVDGKIIPNAMGTIVLSEDEFLQLLKKAKILFGAGWSASYRNKSGKNMADDIMNYIESWNLGKKRYLHDHEEMEYVFYDAIGRITGNYQKEFVAEIHNL